jgi:hypothetical protein
MPYFLMQNWTPIPVLQGDAPLQQMSQDHDLTAKNLTVIL